MLDKSKSESDARSAPTNVPWAVVINTGEPEAETHPDPETADESETAELEADAETDFPHTDSEFDSTDASETLEANTIGEDADPHVPDDGDAAVEEASEAVVEPEPAVVEPEAEARAEPEAPVSVVEAEAAQESEPEAEAAVEPEPVVEAEPEAVVEAEVEAAVESEPVVETELEAAAEPEPETEAKPEAAVEPESEVEVAAAVPEVDSEEEVEPEPVVDGSLSEADASPEAAADTTGEAEQAAPVEAPFEENTTRSAQAEDQATEPQVQSETVTDASCDDAVIRSLMDVLITPAGMVQPQERAFAADLLLHVVEYATPEAKHMLCDRLSNMPDAPAALISRFIGDSDLELSATLLLNASCVSDSELIAVVENADRDRSLLVAKRQHLSAAVGTALAKTGDVDLAMALVRNHYVQLSQEALQRLSDMALEHEELIEPLIMRPEMTAACALYLFWAMPAKQRSYALGRFLAEVQVLPQILVMSKPGADLVATALRVNGEAAKQQSGDPAQLEKPSKKKAAELVEALTGGCADTLAEVIATHAAIEAETAERVVGDVGGEPLTVACKALGVSRFAFGDALAAWQAARGLDPDTEALQLLFDTLSFKQARMALTYWDWQTQGIGPYRDAYFELSR